MAALIPGLPVQVEGTYNEKRELAATSVKFKGDDLQQAQAIQAGMHETEARSQQNQAELDKQRAALEVERAKIDANKSELEKQNAAVAANKAAIAANTTRFGQLDYYYIWDEVTVYFANG